MHCQSGEKLSNVVTLLVLKAHKQGGHFSHELPTLGVNLSSRKVRFFQYVQNG